MRPLTSFTIYDRQPPKRRKKLKELLMKRWEEAKKKKVFNYDLNCMYKLLPGDYNFSIQLNVERGQLRRKPMRFRSINEPFNNIRWNFTKLTESEMLIYLKCDDKPISDDPLDRHVLAVNASPLERGHSLVVPCINKCLPQKLTHSAIRLSTDMMLLVRDEMFHILFNSLLGHASVNHLHVHALFWPYDSDLINRRFECLSPTPDDVYQIRPPDWFVPAFAFQLANASNLDRFVGRVSSCVDFLTSRDVAHNVFFTRAPPIRVDGPQWIEDRARELPLLVTVYVFPRRSITGAKPAMNFNPAANELAGCLTSYTWRFFESVTELSALRVIEEECALGDKQFNQLSSDLCAHLTSASSTGTVNGDLATKSREASTGRLEEMLTSPELDELHDSFHTFQLRSPKRLSSVPDARLNARSSAINEFAKTHRSPSII